MSTTATTNFIDTLPEVLVERIFLWRDFNEADAEFETVRSYYDRLIADSAEITIRIRKLYDMILIHDIEKIELARTLYRFKHFDRDHLRLYEFDDMVAKEIYTARNLQIAILSRLAECERIMGQLDERSKAILDKIL